MTFKQMAKASVKPRKLTRVHSLLQYYRSRETMCKMLRLYSYGKLAKL